MMSDDNDRDIPGAGSQGQQAGGPEREILDVDAEHIESDLSYSRRDTIDIEQELERALAEDGAADVAEEDVTFDFSTKKAPSSSGMSKFIAPVVVLVLAAGAAGFIVKHPEVIGRNAPAPVVASAPEAAKPSSIVLAEADTSRPSNVTAEAAPPAPPADTIPPVPAAVPSAPDATAAAPVPPTSAAEPSAGAESASAIAQPMPAADSDLKADPAHEAAAVKPAGNDEIKVAQADVAAAAPAPAAAPAAVAPPVPAAPPAEPPALSAPVAEANPVPTPPNDALTPPPPAPADPAAAAGVSKAAVVQGGLKKDREDYYDSNATLPTGQMANAVGPRKVNPSIEPGQKLVVVSGIRKSTDSESMIVAADRALKLGRYDAALEMYNTLFAKNPHDQRILMGRAVAQQNLGQNDAAIDSYEKLLDLSPNNADAMVNMLGLLKQKDPTGAMQRMKSLESKFPNHAGLAAQLGLAEGEAGDYDSAIRDLGKAASIEPTNPQHPFNMAVLADRKGDTATAIKYYELALQTDSINSQSSQSIPRETVYDRLATLRRR